MQRGKNYKANPSNARLAVDYSMQNRGFYFFNQPNSALTVMSRFVS